MWCAANDSVSRSTRRTGAEAKEREKERLAELARRPADSAQRGRSYGALDVTKAIEAYAKERRAQVSPRMVAY